jgi:solute:Na+ symporter, SSS family
LNLGLIDWIIVLLIFGVLIGVLFLSKSLMRSVADFLAAGRTGGRYLITLSSEAAGIAAISIVAYLEMNYITGFTMQWWSLTTAVATMLMTVSGWILYRFRQTRCLTMAQFFEVRYSRKFRIFTGILSFLSGIINFGIFPAVSARFFLYFCGFPDYINILGIQVSTFVLLTLLVIFIPLYFVFTGGHVSIMMTDFFQGVFINIVLLIIIVFFLFKIDWNQIFTAVSTAPENASLLNPFKTGNTKDFNFWYFLIFTIGLFYGKLSWHGAQAYNVSSKSAHEAKMGDVLYNWRNIFFVIFVVFIPVVAYTIMHNPEFISVKASVDPVLNSVGSATLKNQLVVPLVLTNILPKGLMGAFVAIMFAAAITCHAPYLHSWGSILIQDVIIPLRGKPFEPKQHIRLLKYSIFGVAVFIFIFSLLFRETEHILLFFAVTGAIYTGGSGAVIIGGLYWKRGTTSAAWIAMIVGSAIAVGGIIILQIIPDFPINGMTFWGIAMFCSSMIYILVSLFGRHENADMDRILNRGKYENKNEVKIINEVPLKGWKVLGIGKEFTKFDKIIYITTYIYTFTWIAVFIFGTIHYYTSGVSDIEWLNFWKTYIWINTGILIVVVIWLTAGGFIDLKEMIVTLRLAKPDDKDSGFVEKKDVNEIEKQ